MLNGCRDAHLLQRLDVPHQAFSIFEVILRLVGGRAEREIPPARWRRNVVLATLKRFAITSKTGTSSEASACRIASDRRAESACTHRHDDVGEKYENLDEGVEDV